MHRSKFQPCQIQDSIAGILRCMGWAVGQGLWGMGWEGSGSKKMERDKYMGTGKNDFDDIRVENIYSLSNLPKK